jgi:hypothetical protein
MHKPTQSLIFLMLPLSQERQLAQNIFLCFTILTNQCREINNLNWCDHIYPLQFLPKYPYFMLCFLYR